MATGVAKRPLVARCSGLLIDLVLWNCPARDRRCSIRTGRGDWYGPAPVCGVACTAAHFVVEQDLYGVVPRVYARSAACTWRRGSASGGSVVVTTTNDASNVRYCICKL